MERLFRQAQWVLARGCLVLAAAAAVAGCRSACLPGDCATGPGGHRKGHPDAHIDNCADIPPGAIPAPVGTYTNTIIKRQIEKGDADEYVVYYNEWLDGEKVLGPFGRDHLTRMIARLPDVPFPVMMQPEPDKPELNRDRHAALVEALVNAGIADAPNRVVVGRPWGEGLFGEEGERIYPRLLQGGFGGNFNGGFGGGGFGGGNFSGGFGGGFGGGGFGGFSGSGIGIGGGGIGGGFGFQ